MKAPAAPEKLTKLAVDTIKMLSVDAVEKAIIAGYDWGGRAACVAAALWPDRCIGLVSVNSYLIQNIAKAMVPVKPEHEVPLWYQYYFQLERGRAGLAANRRGIARILWRQWSPNWHFDDATFERTVIAHDNPDYVDVVIHSYRHRFGLAEGDPQYADIQRRLAALPPITVPAITLDGEGDGVALATDGTASANKFAVRPCTYKNRSSARSPVAVLPSDPAFSRVASASTNPMTSSAVRSPTVTPSSPSPQRADRKDRAARR